MSFSWAYYKSASQTSNNSFVKDNNFINMTNPVAVELVILMSTSLVAGKDYRKQIAVVNISHHAVHQLVSCRTVAERKLCFVIVTHHLD